MNYQNVDEMSYKDLTKTMVNLGVEFPKYKSHYHLKRTFKKFLKGTYGSAGIEDPLIGNNHPSLFNEPEPEPEHNLNVNDESFQIYFDNIKKHSSSSMRKILKKLYSQKGENLTNLNLFKLLNDQITRNCIPPLQHFSVDRIKQIVENIDNEDGQEFYIPLECLVKSIFYKIGQSIESDNLDIQLVDEKINHFFRPFNKIARGADGEIYATGLLGMYTKGANTPIFIIKKPLGEDKKNEQQIHEVVVSRIIQSSILNQAYDEDQIARDLHNFVYCYGGMFVQNVYGGRGTHFYSVFEYINGSTFETSLYTLSNVDKIGYILNMCDILEQAQKNCRFMHNDLHVKNVFLRQRYGVRARRRPLEVNIGDEYEPNILTVLNAYPVIFDYGRAIVEFEDQVVYPMNYESQDGWSLGSRSGWFYPSWDIFFFIYTMIMNLAFEDYKANAQYIADIALTPFINSIAHFEEFVYKAILEPEKHEIMAPPFEASEYPEVFTRITCKDVKKHIIRRLI